MSFSPRRSSGRVSVALVLLGLAIAALSASAPVLRPPVATAGDDAGGRVATNEQPTHGLEAAAVVYLPLIVGPDSSDDPVVEDFVRRVVERTNLYRAQHGCPALTLNDQLTQAAQRHSQDMALNDFFGHTGSDGSLAWDRIRAAGYQFISAAENVAAGYATPEDLVDNLYNETPPNDQHRQNILNCAFRDIGIGYYYLADDTGRVNYFSYWAQVFGTR